MDCAHGDSSNCSTVANLGLLLMIPFGCCTSAVLQQREEKRALMWHCSNCHCTRENLLRRPLSRQKSRKTECRLALNVFFLWIISFPPQPSTKLLPLCCPKWPSTDIPTDLHRSFGLNFKSPFLAGFLNEASRQKSRTQRRTSHKMFCQQSAQCSESAVPEHTQNKQNTNQNCLERVLSCEPHARFTW